MIEKWLCDLRMLEEKKKKKKKKTCTAYTCLIRVAKQKHRLSIGRKEEEAFRLPAAFAEAPRLGGVGEAIVKGLKLLRALPLGELR